MSSMGGCYNLRYLGCTPLSKFNTGFSVLQKPLHDLYVSYLTPKGMRQPIASRLALTDRGVILTSQGNDIFYSMREVLLWEAVQWVRVQTKDKKFVAAFEPIDPDRHRGKDSLFSKLDSQYKYLTKLSHEPLLVCVLRRTSGPKTIDVHAFVCASEVQAFDIVASITQVQQLYQSADAHRNGVFEYAPFQEVPGSVRLPSGSSAAQLAKPNGFRSQRQVKPNVQRGDGEITLEELVRLADMALADPMKSGSGGAAKDAAAPAFRMGESWGAMESQQQQHGVRRSKTFNEGPRRNAAPESRATDQSRLLQSNPRLDHLGLSETPRGGGVGGSGVGGGGVGGGGAGGAIAWKQLQDARYYENVSAPPTGQQRVYENLSVPGSNPTDNLGPRPTPVAQPRINQHQQQRQQHQQQPRGSLDDRDGPKMNGQQQQEQMIDPMRRKSMPPESLRMVIAESRMAKQRVSVLPGADTDFVPITSASAFNVSSAGDPRARAIVDIQFEQDQPFQPSPSPKPVAMVQPRKVSGVKVLPEPGLEGFPLHKVALHSGKGPDEQKKEQYQRGDAGNKNFTRSMFELNNAAAKPTTPQASRKFTNAEPEPARKFTSAEPEPVRKFTSADPEPARKFTIAEPEPARKFTSAEPEPVRKFTSAEPEPARKSSNPDVLNRDGRENKAAEKPAGEKGKKDAELEAFALNINFYKPPTNTLSPHGTNFESALGYFP